MSGAGNAQWAALMVEELARNGVRHIAIAPGSRCAPLTVAAARHPGVATRVHFDERAAGFYALGWARGTGQPAAVITTSGTAAANLLPAVAEASQDRAPMLLFTADRPPEMRATDANQTLVQPGLFGSYVRWSVDMPCPSDEIDAAYVLTTIDQACYRACRRPAGPVHVNVMVREPLVVAAEAPGALHDGAPAHWREGTMPYTLYPAGADTLPRGALSAMAERLGRANRGVILMGYVADASAGAEVEALAEILGWPILPDLTSGLRLGAESPTVIEYADWVGAEAAILDDIDLVLHVGGRMVDTSLPKGLAARRGRDYLQMVSHPDRHDPLHQVTLRVEADEGACCKALAQLLRPGSARGAGWLQRWQAESDRVGAVLARTLDESDELSEPWVARRVAADLPDAHALVVGNSRPVRDVQRYAHRERGDRIVVAANRAVSGIDGIVATAAGFTAARGTPTTLLIGDVSLLHDLTSLHLLGAARMPVTLVVINNDGGGIFQLLPYAEAAADVLESHFGAPHGLTFSAAARMFGLEYWQPSGTAGFREAYRNAVHGGGPGIIEVRTSREAIRSVHRRLEAEVRSPR